MEQKTTPLSYVLERVDERLRSTDAGTSRVWPTGFEALDQALSGGFRSSGLALLAGPQGLGKTTFALQVARNIVRAGRHAVYFSYEHDPEDLMERLVAMEAGELYNTDSPGLEKIRAAFEDHESSTPIEQRLSEFKGGVEALTEVLGYADRLHIHRSTGTSTDLELIETAVLDLKSRTGQAPFVVVDYLQKVKVPVPGITEEERTSIVVEGLKDFAIDADLPVLAVVAADKVALEAGKRMRVNHLRGSSSLAYEADVVLIFNDKFDIVARHHLVYDLNSAERFHQWAVLSVEKNRSGKGGMNLEFRKRFEQSRFDPDGRLVIEQLIDERIFSN